jgi:hypothetical protein
MTPSLEPVQAVARNRSLHERLLKPGFKSLSSLRKTKARVKRPDDVRDGKLFHIRITVGYLTSLRISEVGSASHNASDEPMLSAYATFGLSDDERGEYDCATSQPLLTNVAGQNVKWPKGSEVKTSKRRLYYSVLLRSDDSTTVSGENNFNSFDEDDADAIRGPSNYAPELVNLYIGLKRGDEKVIIAAATLAFTGQQVANQQIDIPVRKVALPAGSKQPVNADVDRNGQKPRKTGLKNLFARKLEYTGIPVLKSHAGATFSGDNKKYSCDKNSVLQIKVDVMEGLYQTNGPGLWGDLEDDEESFGPVPVIDIPEEFVSELSDTYKHESIEVCAFKRGTTIIATPGVGEAEEHKVERVSKKRSTKKKPRQLEEFFAEPKVSNQPFLLCGYFDGDLISELPMTSSVTDADEDSLSSDSDTEGSSSALSSVPESATMETVSGGAPSDGESRSTAPQNFPIFQERFIDESDSGEDKSTKGGASDEETCTDDENGLEEAEAATSMLLRYASRLGVPVEDVLDAAGNDNVSSSHGTSSYGDSSKGTGAMGNPMYPGDASSFTGDQSTVEESMTSGSSNAKGWFR